MLFSYNSPIVLGGKHYDYSLLTDEENEVLGAVR